MAAPRHGDPLRLRATDEDDLRVLAAHLQDAVVQVCDMAYLPSHHRFAMMVNRFMWEDLQPHVGPHADDEAPYRRTRTAVHFEGVLGAKTQAINLAHKEAVAVLMTMTFASSADGAGVLQMTFAGGGAIRLDLECLEIYLTDMGQPWPTKNLPQHDASGGEPLG
ncbi:MAG TPA: DUF2948 domain-containing protein [Alphaproteobacteria bacterium]|nr:DUF2948 domain-containing protein [Alphaproteobacteria bacterium]HAJ45914.1 DUF2948 domain-containing protein [Alphaproteobacteria bacterium]